MPLGFGPLSGTQEDTAGTDNPDIPAMQTSGSPGTPLENFAASVINPAAAAAANPPAPPIAPRAPAAPTGLAATLGNPLFAIGMIVLGGILVNGAMRSLLSTLKG